MSRQPERITLADDGRFPNSALPLLVYRGVLAAPSKGAAADFERLFSEHGWPAAWRNGIYDFHHYHSTAHEVLGVYAGSAQARFGGEQGQLVTLQAGDVVVIPAGVAHCNAGQSADFAVVGAYPVGTEMDMNQGKPRERPRTDANIRALPLPGSDPVFGKGGPLLAIWAAPESGGAEG